MNLDRLLRRALEEYQAGRLPEAERLYRQILELRPENPDALHMLGLLASRAGQAAAGIDLIKRAIAASPSAAEYYVNLGTLLEPEGRLDEATAAYAKARELRPDLPEVHNNLGNTLAAAKQSDLAIASFSEALRLRPDYPDALFGLANAVHDLGRYEEAVAAYRRSIELRPQWPPGYNNLGMSLRELGRRGEAIEAFKKALAIWPAESHIHKNLGDTYQSHGDIDSAIASLERAVALQPTNVEAITSVGNAYKDRAQLDEALAHYRKALAIDPDFAPADSNRVYTVTMHPGYDGKSILQEVQTWQRHLTDRFKNLHRPHANDRSPDRRLRIGYVSGDLRDHVVGRNVFPLFRDRDRGQFEVFCYYNNHHGDAMTSKFQAMSDSWRVIAKMDDDKVADLIRADGIDILVDLSLHTGGNRLMLFARKPAPIQVTFAGYPGGTGLSAMDWRLTDPHLDPPGADGDYAEKSYRLAHSFWCYDPEAFEWEPDSVGTPPPQVGPLPAIRNGYVTFGCLNNFCKMNQDVLNLWGRVLAAVEGSRILVMAVPGECRRRVLEAMARAGVAPERVEFVIYQPRRSYLALFNKIDLALDTFPYNGHTASLDAMWMGVPVITRVGRTVVGRAGLSQLTNLGLRELAAADDAQFIDLATRWAGDLLRLEALRQSLRRRMLDSPLADGPRFTKNIETAYRSMWKELIQRPTVPEFHLERGNDLSAVNRFEEAVSEYQKALSLRPEYAEAENNLGNALFRLERLDESVAAIKRALAIRPDYADARNNLGNVLFCLGRLDEAVGALREAIALRPDYADAFNNLGNALSGLGRYDEANAAYGQTLKLRPNWPEARNNLAVCLYSQGNLDGAEAEFRAIFDSWPDYAQGHVNFGNVLRAVGRLDESIGQYERALEIEPKDAAIASSRLFILQFHPDLDPQRILAEHQRWDERFARGLWKSRDPRDCDPRRRLRIGYVSPDFRLHCQSLFTEPLLSHHDREQFEVFCYCSVGRPDAITARLREHANVWRETKRMNDQAVAELVRADGIDILVDLTMHMTGGRPLLMARKPADVQVSWLAYPGTTGLREIDYRLTDPYLDPAGMYDDCYTERSVRLPETFWCYDPYGMEFDRSSSADPLPIPANPPGLRNGYITFGCLNDFCKMNAATLSLWGRVMRAVTGSRLRLLAPEGSARRWTLEKLKASGVSADRVDFVSRKPRCEYLAEYWQIDICVDTFPYNGHTTSLDAYWMGVPVVTRIGRTVVGRAGLSQLSNLGLSELAAENDDRFVEIAVGLAGDMPRLVGLHGTLRDRMMASPLMDAGRFARNMEAAYRAMWQSHCRQNK
jgi:predicted O-linked N-acetylglucosamine transferase (SPINDLY family)